MKPATVALVTARMGFAARVEIAVAQQTIALPNIQPWRAVMKLAHAKALEQMRPAWQTVVHLCLLTTIQRAAAKPVSVSNTKMFSVTAQQCKYRQIAIPVAP